MLPEKSLFRGLLFLIAFSALASVAGASPPSGETQPLEPSVLDPSITAGKAGFRIEKNLGQAPEGFDFLARTGTYTAFLSSRELILGLTPAQGRESLAESKARRWNPSGDAETPAPARPIEAVEMRWVGSRPAVPGKPGGELSSVGHYLKGRDPRGWIRNIPHFSSLRYEGVYPLIDLVYRQEGGHLKFDLIVQPGGEPGDIELELSGAEDISITPQGGLEIRTGSRALQLVIPAIFQEIQGERQAVEGKFLKVGARRVAFEIGEYRPEAALYIDPVIRVFEEFVDAEGETRLEAVARDFFGGAVVAGSTLDPMTLDRDIRVARFDPDGNLTVDVQLGGSETDAALTVAVGPFDHMVIAGLTESDNLPVPALGTLHPYGGDGDGFVLRLFADGSGVEAGTFLGGSSQDVIRGLLVDEAQEITVAGSSRSPDFPLVDELSQFEGDEDGFLARLDLSPAATQLLFSTHLGGDRFDSADALVRDDDGNLYLGGRTSSERFPVPDFQANGFQPEFAGGAGVDGFVLKMVPDGSEILYATYFGGSEGDGIDDIAVDGEGRVFAVGGGLSSDLPLLPGSLQPSSPYDGPTGFLLQFSPLGTELAFSSPIGGAGIFPEAVALESGGHVYITGTATVPFPREWPNYEPLDGGEVPFLAVLSHRGRAIDDLVFLTPTRSLASGSDVAVVDEDRSVYVVGTTAEILGEVGGAVLTGVDRGLLHKYTLGSPYQYAAKVVCGIQPQVGGHTGILARGQYGTSVNVHNPSSERVRFRKTLAMSAPLGVTTFPPEVPGPILPIASHDLAPLQALRVDCQALNQEVGPNNPGNQWAPPGFMEGFVVIESDGPLNVTAIYTSGPLPGQQQEPGLRIPELDVEQIHERFQSTDHDISVATEIRCLAGQADSHFLGETRVTNHGSVPVENVIVEDFFDGSTQAGLPNPFFQMLRDSYTVSQGATWSFPFDQEDNDNDRLRAVIEIPVLPPGQSAVISRRYQTPFLLPNYSPVVVTAEPKSEDPFKSNNSFTSLLRFPECAD